MGHQIVIPHLALSHCKGPYKMTSSAESPTGNASTCCACVVCILDPKFLWSGDAQQSKDIHSAERTHMYANIPNSLINQLGTVRPCCILLNQGICPVTTGCKYTPKNEKEIWHLDITTAGLSTRPESQLIHSTRQQTLFQLPLRPDLHCEGN